MKKIHAGAIGKQTGFSLVELLLAMALISVLLAGFYGLFSVSLRSWVIGNSQTEVQQGARQAVDLMTREIQYSKKEQAVITNSNSQLTIQTGQYGTLQTISYYLDATGSPKTVIRADATGTRAISGASSVNVSVEELVFSSMGNGTVGIRLTVVDLARPGNRVQIDTAVTALN